MNPDFEQYYLSKDERVKSCLLALRAVILRQDVHITETRKWKMPCFCYKKKMFGFLWTDKKTDEPYMLMVEGKHLDHPALQKGDRSRMKILRIDPDKDLPMASIERILNDALNIYRRCRQDQIEFRLFPEGRGGGVHGGTSRRCTSMYLTLLYRISYL